jgi:hypothetical protein
MNKIMKKYSYINLFFAFCLIVTSCGDDILQADLKSQKGMIQVTDKTSGQALKGYRVELYQLTGINSKYKAQEILSISPNPFSSYFSFRVNVEKPSNIEIYIINLLTLIKHPIYKDTVNNGILIKSVNFDDSLNIENGMYKAYLKINGDDADSVNFIYSSKINQLLTSDRKLYYLNSFITDNDGNISTPNYLSNLINENFTITAENGIKLGTYKLTNHLRIFIYDMDMNKIAETYTTFEIIRDVGLLLSI